MSKRKRNNFENKQKINKKPKNKTKKLSFFPPQSTKKATSNVSREEKLFNITDKKVNHSQQHPKKDINTLNLPKLKKMLSASKQTEINDVSLRTRMIHKLKSARFRYLNEELYSLKSTESFRLFQSDPKAFKTYHEGYKQQVSQWPLNPLDKIIAFVREQSNDCVIADFGCGEGKLAESVPHKVHSFDLVAVNDKIIAGDMTRTRLKPNSINIAVFCLSLMGTNIHDYLKEANRVLQTKGILKIVEVESRFDDVNNFIKAVTKFGFSLISNDFSHNLFYFFDFQKEHNIKNLQKLPTVSLLPCLYKKR